MSPMMAKEGLGCSKYEQLCRCRTSLGRLAGSDQHYSSPWWSSIWTNNITQAARIPHTGPSPPFTCRAQKELQSILQRDPCSAAGGEIQRGKSLLCPWQARSRPRFPLWQLNLGRAASPYPASNLAKGTQRFSRGELQFGNDEDSKDLSSLEDCFPLNVFAEAVL